MRGIEKHIANKIMSFEQSKLMTLITHIPDLFLPVLIFESDEIEGFDIGYTDFWLITKADDWGNIRIGTDEYFEHLRNIYSISIVEPDHKAGYFVKYYQGCLIQKPTILNGGIDESLAYKPIIETMLYLNQTK